MKKISNEEYQNLFIRWQDSGISKAEFAALEGISKTTFYYWCRKFEEGTAQGDMPGFSHIGSVPGFQKEPYVRINYPSGVSIEFFGQVSPDSIKGLL